MRRLLWKEWHEQRWLALCWAACILAVALFAQGLAFCGDQPLRETRWHALLFILSLLAGLQSHAADAMVERASFLFSRPVAWWQPLLAKLLLALAVIAGSLTLAALLLRLTAPLPYRPLLTLADAWGGIWPLALLLGGWYLLGLACSSVVPRLSGGMLTLMAVLLLSFALIALLPAFDLVIGLYHINVAPIFTSWCSAVAGALVAGLSLFHYRLTLDVGARIRRFAALFLVTLVACRLLGAVALSTPVIDYISYWQPLQASWSLSGEHALVAYTRHLNLLGLPVQVSTQSSTNYTFHLVRTRDGASLLNLYQTDHGLALSSPREWSWYPHEVAIGRQPDNQYRILRAEPPALQGPFPGKPLAVSPDGHRLLVCDSLPDGRLANPFLLDLRTLRHNGLRLKGALCDIEWRTNNVLQYRDDQGRMQVFFVGE